MGRCAPTNTNLLERNTIQHNNNGKQQTDEVLDLSTNNIFQLTADKISLPISSLTFIFQLCRPAAPMRSHQGHQQQPF